MATDYDDLHAPPPVSRLWWAVPAVGMLLIVTAGLIWKVDPQDMLPTPGTSYNAGAGGFGGVYTILDELGYPINRTRRPTGSTIRWVLAPKKLSDKATQPLIDWVRHGGRMLLADKSGDFSKRLGIHVIDKIAPLKDNPTTTVSDVRTLAVGNAEVTPSGDAGRTWASAGGQPIVSIHKVGEGDVWLLHRPEIIANDMLRQADNAVFVARLAEAMLADHLGPIGFDEFAHGYHDRPGVVELLWQVPLRYIVLQFLLCVGFHIWMYGIRFGPLRPLPPPNRRSKEEFLDALADLLQRQGDYNEAFRTVQGTLLRQLAADSGMPASAHADAIVNHVARRRGVDPRKWLPILEAPGSPGGKSQFLNSLRQLEAAGHELRRR